MWTIPSRGRPGQLARLIATCEATGMTTPALVRVDDDDPRLPEYRALAFPRGWVAIEGPRWPLGEIYNWAFQGRPDAGWYGFLADDVVPETPGWDRELCRTAGRDGMAVPASGAPTGPCPHFVLGGDLVRSVGWLALPGLDRLWIDTVWKRIAEARDVYRERPDIMLRHHHFSNGLALRDSTYRKPRAAEDRIVFDKWRKTANLWNVPGDK